MTFFIAFNDAPGGTRRFIVIGITTSRWINNSLSKANVIILTTRSKNVQLDNRLAQKLNSAVI